MSEKKLRIAFMGTPDFALAALKALCTTDHEIICVYSQPPRPKGRGHQVQKSPVHEFAETQGIPVYTPHSLKSKAEQETFAAHDLDVAIVAAYGLILPEVILQAPQYGCLNIHASLLPRWRGAAPIQYAIWSGDSQTGVTIMQMEKGLDTGPMIAKEAIPITPDMTASVLHDALAVIGANMMQPVLAQLAQTGSMLDAQAQDNAQTTYASMLQKTDGVVEWSKPAAEIDRQIRALNPWPGVWTKSNGKRLKILSAQMIENAQSNVQSNAPNIPGTFFDQRGYVQCGQSTVLRLLMVQPEGKKPMDTQSAINGGYLTLDSEMGP